MDVVTAFLENCTINKLTGEITASGLDKAYNDWAKENNEYMMSNRKFGTEISKKFEKVRKSNGQVYIGLELSKYFMELHSLDERLKQLKEQGFNSVLEWEILDSLTKLLQDK